MSAFTLSFQLRVLIVEDDENHFELVRQYLVRAGADRITFHRVRLLREALGYLESNHADVVLLDLSLPDSPVHDTLQNLSQASPEIAIVVLTSLDDLELAVSSLQNGAQDYLVKSEMSSDLIVRSLWHAVTRNHVRRELERSNLELQRFAHTIAHEVRNPLSVVSYFTYLVEKNIDLKNEPKLEEYLQMTRRSVTGLTTLVNELLAFAKVTTDDEQFDVVNVHELLQEIKASMQHELVKEKAIVTHDPLPEVRGSQVQLRHLFHNLIGNAVKYRGKETPQIHVSVRETDGKWTFGIHDNGRGIPADSLERIFDVFYRCPTHDEIEGTGIGLAFCKRVVERHHGNMWVDSKMDHGSTFSFSLPKSPE